MSQTLPRGTAPASVLRAVSTAVILLMLAFAALWVWFAIAANYDYAALAGTYSFHERGVSCTLRLATNQTFHQDVTVDGHTLVADGIWSRHGEGGVSFANLLAYPFEGDITSATGAPQRNSHRELDGEFVKALTLFPKLEIQGYPVLRKRIFGR